jgi:hypothetical protein
VFFQLLRLYRKESSCADVQGDGLDIHSAGTNLLEQRKCKVEASSGRGYRPFRLRVYGLIAGPVIDSAPFFLGFNVGRQRNLTDFLEGLEQVETAFESETAMPFLVFLEQFRGELNPGSTSF